MSDLLASLRRAVDERGIPPHPDVVAPILHGNPDPTSRASTTSFDETITRLQRSEESALAYYTIEGLFVALTPAAMCAVAFCMLQILSGDHGGELPEGVTLAQLDVWGELREFQPLVTAPHEGHDHEPLTAAEECRRALWHLSNAYEAALAQ